MFQAQRKCYCNKTSCSCCCRRRTQTPKTTPTTTKNALHSLSKTKSQKERTKGEKFVKIRSSNTNGRGLGHSQHNKSGNGAWNNNNNFSRRNSAATTTTTASTGTNATQISFETIASSKNERTTQHVGGRDTGGGSYPLSACVTPTKSSKYELTERRSHYERCKEASALAHSDIIGAWTSAMSATPTVAAAPPIDERFYGLQQWRVQNPDDCFTVHRQNDLKMQQRLRGASLTPTFFASTSSSTETNPFCVTLKPRTNYVVDAGQQSHKPPLSSLKAEAVDLKTLTPYAVRQKLLQLRLQAQAIAEHKPGPAGNQQESWAYGVMDKSCALRYQATY